MVHRIFVYGTLKQGFCNSAVNGGRRVPGEFETLELFPLYVIGALGLPWLVDAAGEGQRVAGQLFEVADADLPRMDALERIDQPGWYARKALQVVAVGDLAAVPQGAQAYFGCRSRLASEPIHLGPLAEYTLAHQALYRGRAA